MAESASEVQTLLRFLAIVSLALAACGAASAQSSSDLLYSWTDPKTGSNRYSNFPPAWYRRDAPADGPAVRVYYYQRLVDDTALPLTDREALVPKAPQKSANASRQK